MRLVRRSLVILFGYGCAAITGSVVLLLIATVRGTSPSDWPDLDEFIQTAGLFAFIAATIGIPVTLPVIMFAEINPKLGLITCLLGGLLLGTVMGSLLNWNGFRLEPMIAAVIASVCGAMTYWLISCFALPPTRTESGSDSILRRNTA